MKNLLLMMLVLGMSSCALYKDMPPDMCEPLAEGHVLTAYHHEILGGLFEWTTYQHDCDQCALKKMYEDGVEGVTKVNEAY